MSCNIKSFNNIQLYQKTFQIIYKWNDVSSFYHCILLQNNLGKRAVSEKEYLHNMAVHVLTVKAVW